MIPPLAIHVRDVFLDAAATPDAPANTLAHLSPFTAPHLRRLALDFGAAAQLLGERMTIATHDTLREEEYLLRRSFSALVTHIHDLTLREFFPHEAAAILEHFPNLTTLRF